MSESLVDKMTTPAAMFTEIAVTNGSVFNQTGPPRFEFNLSAAVNLILGTSMTLLTIAGQIIVFLVVSRDSRLRDASTYYIASLAVADLLISLSSMPVWTIYTTMGYWPFPQVYCDIWNMMDFCLCATSINVILFISVDRYLCLRSPFEYPLKRTDFLSKVALAAIWVVTFITYSTYIGVTQVVLGKERDIYDCGVYFLNSVSATVTLIIIVLWAPIFGTMIMYVFIYKIAAKVAAGNPSVTVGTIDNGTNKLKDAKSGQDELKAVKTIGLLLLTFVLCWLPITVGFTLNAIYPGKITPWLLIVCYWLGYLNSTLNPVCYALGNPHFKETLRKMFRGP